MICNKCGKTYNSNFNYCIDCGGDLVNNSDDQLLECSYCGTENNEDFKYCIHCGGSLKKEKTKNLKTEKLEKEKVNSDTQIKSSRKTGRSNSKNNFSYSAFLKYKQVWFAVLIIIAGLFFLDFENEDKNITERDFNFMNETNPFTIEVKDIASKFICSCGSCGEKSLEICACDRAKEEKEFIKQSLLASTPEAEIVKSLAEKYGWIKPEYASTYNISHENTYQSNKLEIDGSKVNTIN